MGPVSEAIGVIKRIVTLRNTQECEVSFEWGTDKIQPIVSF